MNNAEYHLIFTKLGGLLTKAHSIWSHENVQKSIFVRLVTLMRQKCILKGHYDQT